MVWAESYSVQIVYGWACMWSYIYTFNTFLLDRILICLYLFSMSWKEALSPCLSPVQICHQGIILVFFEEYIFNWAVELKKKKKKKKKKI
jgi:hypothetical protein